MSDLPYILVNFTFGFIALYSVHEGPSRAACPRGFGLSSIAFMGVSSLSLVSPVLAFWTLENF
jgi:hypothetical protein